MPTILLAVTGLSPAIVTETIWVLAHESPRVLPQRVVFLTTGVGANKIQEQLFTPLPALGQVSAWQALRDALSAGPDELIAEPPRLIGAADPATGILSPLEDIVTPQHNEIAASFILEQVRSIVENPENRLVASIAGGRKTMGALLHAAVSLIGRETDRLTHILVSPPFESLPGFFFPSQPGSPLADRAGHLHHPAAATLALADVPFVPLRNRFTDLNEMPGSFSSLVEKYSRTIQQDANRPRLIEIGYRQKCLWIDGIPIKTSLKALAVLHFLLECQEAKRTPIDQLEAAAQMSLWLGDAPWIPLMAGLHAMDPEGIRHSLNDLRSALKSTGWAIPARSLSAPPFTLRLR